MSRYGWSSLFRESLSPWSSRSDGQEVPHVTEDDFSYITSADLETSLTPPARAYDPQSPPSAGLESDKLLIKSGNVTYPVHFPAFSIGDGRLFVRDVQDRAGLVMNLSARRSRRIKLYYKGRYLGEQDIPIRDYGVKNNSELLATVPEGRISDDDSSGSAEEVIVTDPRDTYQPSKKKSKGGRKKKNKTRDPAQESSANLEVPGPADVDNRRPTPDPSIHPSRVPSPAVPGGPIEKLEGIRSHFDEQLLPLCKQFLDNPPKDPKKREDEHRKLSETVLQHVLLKLDEVQTGGDLDIRARRKDLVNYVQDILKEIDEQLPEGSKPNR
ncbi:BAG domain-containing protein [Biscogniauxia sp. FL1348]|nr:BAG domain-containing protein [Biscogniauxia sp. FL1348]